MLTSYNESMPVSLHRTLRFDNCDTERLAGTALLLLVTGCATWVIKGEPPDVLVTNITRSMPPPLSSVRKSIFVFGTPTITN